MDGAAAQVHGFKVAVRALQAHQRMCARHVAAAILVALCGCADHAPHVEAARTLGESARAGQFAAEQMSRFGEASADRVEVADRDAYFAFLTDRGMRERWLRAHPPPQADGVVLDSASRASSVDVDAILQLTALAKLVGPDDAALTRSLRAALVGGARAFADAYASMPERSVNAANARPASPTGSEWNRAEAAWIAWVNTNLRELTSSERLVLAEEVFVRSRAHAFPGIDRPLLGFLIADEWAKAGYPDEQHEGDARTAELNDVLCFDDSHRRRHGSACSPGWYEALGIDARALRAGLDARHDPKIERLVLGGLARPTPSGPAALRALVGDWPRWGRAFDLALESANRDGAYSDLKRPLVYEARAAWQAARSGERGPVMLRLARVDFPNQSYDGVMFVDWRHFTEWFGGHATAEDFAGFLDADPTAWAMTGLVWPSLGADFSRAAVIVPRLRAHLGNAEGERDAQSLGGIAYRLCDEGRTGEMAEISQVLLPLAEAHPGTRFVALAKEFADVARCRHVARRTSARRST
jgi:hypothetical protein